MMIVFIDTSGWIAIMVKKDRNYGKASEYFEALLSSGASLLTSNYVISETYTRLRYDVGHREAVRFHRIVQRAKDEKKLKVVYADEKIEAEAWKIFERYSDQVFSFVDCTSFVMCRKNRVDEVFAFDKDFIIAGFVVKP